MTITREQLSQQAAFSHDLFMPDLKDQIERLEALRDQLGMRNLRNLYFFDDIQRALVHARGLQRALSDIVVSSEML